MRSNYGALSADRFIAFLTEVFERLLMEGTIFILLVHVFEFVIIRVIANI